MPSSMKGILLPHLRESVVWLIVLFVGFFLEEINQAMI